MHASRWCIFGFASAAAVSICAIAKPLAPQLPDIELLITVQTRLDLRVRCDTQPVALAAELMIHRIDKPNLAFSTGQPIGQRSPFPPDHQTAQVSGTRCNTTSPGTDLSSAEIQRALPDWHQFNKPHFDHRPGHTSIVQNLRFHHR